jgi:predicted esterase
VEVPGFRPAVVSLPLGATGRRPVLVALHGNFDRPEWQCEIWRGIVGARGFVLCPRGVPRGDVPKSWDRWEFGALARTEKELDAALAALAAAYPDHVDPGPVVFTGFSLGAILGTPIVKKSPARYPRVVLIEGGQSGWTRPRAKAFVAGGGARVLFACGQASCQASSRSAAKIVEAAGGGARVAYLGSVGHTYDGKVADAIAMEWDWLVEGDARWR